MIMVWISMVVVDVVVSGKNFGEFVNELKVKYKERK